MRQKKMSLRQRRKALERLIEDSENLGFVKKVVNRFRKQLAEVESEIDKDNEKRKAWKERNK